MKKLKKILLILIGLFPLIVSAEVKEEVKWKWYTFIEDEIHYESDVEQFCEYFENVDKNDYFFGSWNYSVNKPEEKRDREIIETFDTLKIDRGTTNIIMITEFDHNIMNTFVYEIILLDENNNIIEYDIEDLEFPRGNTRVLHDKDLTTGIELDSYTTIYLNLNKPTDIRNIKIKVVYKEEAKEFKGLSYRSYLDTDYMTNAFDLTNTETQTKCENKICETDVSVRKEDFYDKEISFSTRIYKYRDKYFKCYQNKKLYVPGYHKELDGFIKDENDYIIETIKEESTENSVITPNTTYRKEEQEVKENHNFNNFQNNTENKEENTSDISDIEEDTIKKSNINDDMVAIVTKEDKKENKNTLSIIILSLSLIFLLIISLLITKNVIKSRTK